MAHRRSKAPGARGGELTLMACSMPGGSPILGKADHQLKCNHPCAIAAAGVSAIPRPAAFARKQPHRVIRLLHTVPRKKGRIICRLVIYRRAPWALDHGNRKFLFSQPHPHDSPHIERAGSTSLNGPGEIFLGPPRSRPVPRVPSGSLTARRDEWPNRPKRAAQIPLGDTCRPRRDEESQGDVSHSLGRGTRRGF